MICHNLFCKVREIVVFITLIFALGPAVSAQHENRGDLNLNGVPFELADAGIFADYFSIGLAAFTIDLETQIIATDINMDEIVLSEEDYQAMLRILWGEGDPPDPPEDTVSEYIILRPFESTLRIALSFYDNPTDTLLLHFAANESSAITVESFPGYEGISIEHEYTGHNLIIRLMGIYDYPTEAFTPSIIKIVYDGNMPELANMGGLGINGEAIDPILETYILTIGDININGHRYEISDQVLFTNAFNYGTGHFQADSEMQIATTDINRDNTAFTFEDYICFLAVQSDRHGPDDPFGGPFEHYLLLSRDSGMISMSSVADSAIGGIHLIYLISGSDIHNVAFSGDISGLLSTYFLADDTLEIMIYGMGHYDSIPPGPTGILIISYGGDQPVLLAESSVGFHGEFVNLQIVDCGDANTDQTINIADAVFLINYIFKSGPAPDPLEAGDANCDGGVNVADAVYLINYVFKNGPEPCCP